MPDKYQQIRDYHEIELAKQITVINQRSKRIQQILLVILMLVIIVGLVYFYYVCFN